MDISREPLIFKKSSSSRVFLVDKSSSDVIL